MNRDDLIEKAARIFAAGWYGSSDRVDDSARQLADGWLKGVLPLVEADVRERIAAEIEALHPRGRISVATFDQFDSPWSDGCLRCNSQTCRLTDAARIARGADQ